MKLDSDLVELMQTSLGPMILLKTDTVISEKIRQLGDYASDEKVLLGKLIRQGDVVVDVGANIGSHTLFFAAKTGPSGLVFSFEAQRFLFQVLCGNVALNGLLNVHCLPNAVGSNTGPCEVPVPNYYRPNNFGGFPLDFNTAREPGFMITLDSMGLTRCELIKADVEGMEKQVLQGAEQTIRSCNPVLYLENNRPDQADDLIAYIHGHLGYSIFKHGHNILCLAAGSQLPDGIGRLSQLA